MNQSKTSRLRLLQLKKKMAFVDQGIRILTSKRDTLRKEFEGRIQNTVALRKELEQALQEGGRLITLAEAREPRPRLSTAALAARQEKLLSFSVKNIWGIAIADVVPPRFKRGLLERGSAPGYRSPHVDQASSLYESVLEILVRCAVAESHLLRLGGAIKSTSRRVNALERRVAPEIKGEIEDVRNHIDEMAREEVFRVKRFKKLRERR